MIQLHCLEIEISLCTRIRWSLSHFEIVKDVNKEILHRNLIQTRHSCSLPKPTLVGLSKATLDKSLGLAQY